MRINSLQDAKTFVNNSGVSDWEWSGSASAPGFAEFIYQNFHSVAATDYDVELAAYLIKCGEQPRDYLSESDNYINEVINQAKYLLLHGS